MMRHEWTPGIAGEDGVIEAFSVYPLTVIENWRRVESISAALAEYYESITGDQAYNQAKEPVRDALDEAKAKYGAKIKSLKDSLRDESDIERLQQSGELILAYQYNIASDQTELVAQYEVEGDPLHISLDLNLTPLENAQKYFDKYKRAKRARKRVPQLIQATQQKLDYILQLENDLDMAQSWPEIDDVIQAVQQQGFAVHEKQVRRIGGAGRSGPMKLTDKDGYVIYVGRNSRQNEQVAFRIANSDDIWLHARDVPGSHVVIRNDGRRISDDLIEKAASVAAYYSSKQRDAKADVDVTRCKYVKAIKGAGPGMVTYRNEYTITVRPRSAEDVFKTDSN
jgi:predicted ribosome quality control (RQC) complex YloA/Tae2 family protein